MLGLWYVMGAPSQDRSTGTRHGRGTPRLKGRYVTVSEVKRETVTDLYCNGYMRRIDKYPRTAYEYGNHMNICA
jgi:hypothetical protein